MIKITEVCGVLGIGDAQAPTEKDKGLAREVLKYFNVTSEEAPSTGHLKAGKVYDRAQVEKIAGFREGFPA